MGSTHNENGSNVISSSRRNPGRTTANIYHRHAAVSRAGLSLFYRKVVHRRARSETDPNSPYKQLFPAGKGSDWNEIAQHWMFTDGTNLCIG